MRQRILQNRAELMLLLIGIHDTANLERRGTESRSCQM
jgi:hypothetical protein